MEIVFGVDLNYLGGVNSYKIDLEAYLFTYLFVLKWTYTLLV